jgi:hypothetical protein
MRVGVTAVVVMSLSAVIAAAQQPTFRSGTQTVPLYITVTDSAGRLVPDLQKENFRSSTTSSRRKSRCSTTPSGRSRPC